MLDALLSYYLNRFLQAAVFVTVYTSYLRCYLPLRILIIMDVNSVNGIEINIETEMMSRNQCLEEGEEEENHNDFSIENEYLRPSKRNRENDTEEWTTVERRSKRLTLTSERYIGSEESIEVCIMGKDQLPKQFKLAKLLKAENIQNVVRVKYLNSYKVLIYLEKEESANELLNSRYFNDNGYKLYKTMETNHTYGVIKDIDLDLTDEEILESLYCSIKIMGIKRLMRRNNFNGKWESSEAMRICFEGTSLPSQIKIFDTTVRVSPFIFPVTQCSRCWRFGHTAKICPSNKIICPKCGNNHQNCEISSFICNNCGGNHMAMAKSCPVYVKEKRIRELMAEFNCTYKKALTIYVPPSPPTMPMITEKSFPLINNTNHIDISLEDEVDVGASEKRSSLSKSYAEVSKKRSMSSKKGRQASSSTKQVEIDIGRERADSIEEQNVENIDLVSDQDSRDDEEEIISKGKKDDKTKHSTWTAIFQQLREKILDSTLSCEEKLNMCISIFFKSVLSNVLEIITSWPCVKLFTQHG